MGRCALYFESRETVFMRHAEKREFCVIPDAALLKKAK